MIYDNVDGIKDPLKQDMAPPFCRKRNKYITILNETHVNHDQIHHQIHIRNNSLSPILFSPGDSHTKGFLVLLHPGLEGITGVDTDPKGGVVSFKVTPLSLVTEFSEFMHLQDIAPANSPLGSSSLKDCKIMENENEGN